MSRPSPTLRLVDDPGEERRPDQDGLTDELDAVRRNVEHAKLDYSEAELRALACKWYGRGISQSEIARVLNRDRQRIHYWVHSDPPEAANEFWGRWLGPDGLRSMVELDLQVVGRTEFDLDPFASLAAREHVPAKRYIDEAADGFSVEWTGLVNCNPPWNSGDRTQPLEAHPLYRSASKLADAFTSGEAWGVWHGPLRPQSAHYMRPLRDAGAVVVILSEQVWYRRPSGRLERAGRDLTAHVLLSHEPEVRTRFEEVYAPHGIVGR